MFAGRSAGLWRRPRAGGTAWNAAGRVQVPRGRETARPGKPRERQGKQKERQGKANPFTILAFSASYTGCGDVESFHWTLRPPAPVGPQPARRAAAGEAAGSRSRPERNKETVIAVHLLGQPFTDRSHSDCFWTWRCSRPSSLFRRLVCSAGYPPGAGGARRTRISFARICKRRRCHLLARQCRPSRRAVRHVDDPSFTGVLFPPRFPGGHRLPVAADPACERASCNSAIGNSRKNRL